MDAHIDTIPTPKAPAVAPGRWRTLGGFLGDLALLLLFAVAAGFVLMALGMLGTDPGEAMVLLLGMGGLAIGALLVNWLRRATLATIGTHAGQRRAIAIGVVAGLAMFAFSHFWLGLFEWLGHEPEASNAAGIGTMLQQSPWLGWLVLVALAPAVEEFMMRRVLFGRFLAAGFPWLGMLVTGLLFAALHEWAPGADNSVAEWLVLVFDYTVFGVVCAALYWKTGRLVAPIAMHAVNNLLVTVVFQAGLL